MSSKGMEFYRLEDRVLFEAAAAVEIVEAAENNNDPNANMNEADRQAQEARDAIKNAPPENPADAAMAQADVSDVSDMADPDAEFQKLIEGDIPVFDAGDLDPAIDALITDIFHPVVPEGDLMHLTLNNNGETVSTGKELVIINSSVMDADTIISELAPNQEVLRLEAGSDAMQQILDYLDSSDTQYDSIHIVSHGNAGYFVLNGEVFDGDNFDAAEWAAVGEHVTENGDILLYGCNLAENAAGRDFIGMIADASGADVAASTNATGISGDWSLEYSHGLIETTSISVENYAHNLTNYQVSNLNDSGAGSLRQAVIDANANAGADEITFSIDGTITLTSGEISITDSVTITGNGADKTIISGNNASRVFNVNASGKTITFDGLSITKGRVGGNGGGIYVDIGTVNVSNSIISGNSASNSGGGIFFANGTINVSDSTISDNSASDHGGGIYHNSGTMTVSNSTVSGNSASGSVSFGGGIFVTGGTVAVSNSTVSGNMAKSNGGGIYGNTGTVNIVNSTISGNRVTEGQNDGGGIYIDGGTVNLLNSIVIGNTATSGADVYHNRGTVNAKYNTYGTCNITLDMTNIQSTATAVFGANVLADNDGPTKTIALADNSTAKDGVWTRINSSQFQYLANGVWTNFAATTLANRNFSTDQRGYTMLAASTGSYALSTVDSGLMVNVTHDITASDSEITLREALAYAQGLGGSQTVYFSVFINGQEITLTQGQLAIAFSVTIRGNGAANTILSGGSAVRVFNITSGTVTLDGLTITKGNTTSYGGGVYIGGSTVTISNSTISGNSAGGAGGGVYILSGTVTISNSTISGNKASYGGGITVISGTVTLSNSTISDNSAGGGVGGGIAVFSGTLTITGSTISGNWAISNGGGIYLDGGTVNIVNSTVSGNTAIQAQYGGGGIFIYSGTANIVDSTISANSVTSSFLTAGGGGILVWHNTSTVNLLNSIVIGNTGLLGADILNESGTVNAKYNIYGVTYGITVTDSSWGSTNTQSTAAAVFVNTAPADHVYAIKADGVAAYKGTRVGSYVDGTTKYAFWNGTAWRDAADTIDIAAPVTAITGAQNSSNPDVRTQTTLAYNAGAYALSTTYGKGLNVTTSTDWVNPFSNLVSLREAIDYAGTLAAGQTITFATAINGQTITLNSELGELLINFSVTIRGNGAANTIISGGWSGGTATNGVRVFNITGAAAVVTLDGLTVTKGYTTGSGGAIAVSNASANITNSTIAGNMASTGGGGIYFNGGGSKVLNISNSTIAGNRANNGGGIFATSGTANIVDSTITANTATSAQGGGIYADGTVNLLNNILTGNTASNVANDIFKLSGTVNAKYNIYGVISAAALDNTNTQAAAADVFESLTPVNGMYAIKATGVAAYKGALVAKGADGSYYYSIDGGTTYYNAAGTPGATTYTAIATAQNGVSRTQTTLAYNAGAYALSTVYTKDYTIVTTNLDDRSVLNPFVNNVTLREALAYAKGLGTGTETVTFNAGLGTITLNSELGELVINFSVTVRGNGAANTIISGNDAVRVFNIDGAATVVTLDGMTVTKGYTTGIGGGIYTAGGTVTITNSTISDNSADLGGGGISAVSGTVTITNSTVSGNSTNSVGGGIRVAGGTLAVSNSTISGNEATDGGGIFVNSALTVVNSTISGNTATNNGGGIASGQNCTLTIINSTITANSAVVHGGGFYTDLSTTIYLMNSIVVGNFLSGNADDIYRNSSNLYAKYNIYGTCNVTLDATNTQSTATAVFDTTDPDNPYAIKATGAAAYKGTKVGTYDDSGTTKYAFWNGTAWRDAADTIDIAAAVTAITTAQNSSNPDVRTLGGTVYNAGAYALSTTYGKGLNVTSSTDWVNPFSNQVSLREAIAYAKGLATGTETVTFADGLGTITLDAFYGALAIDYSVTVQGNGAANTIISGGWSGGANTDGVRVFNITGAGTVVTLDGLTVTKGYTTGNGGGIYGDTGSTITVNNSTLNGNRAANGGGGICVDAGTVAVNNSEISGNTASIFGGGIYVYGGSITITDSEISGNTASDGGGGIYVVDSTTNVSNTTISGNTAYSGGGIFVNGGTVAVSNSTINGNTASFGGGIYINAGGTLNMTNSTIIGNTAGYAGGIFVYDGVANVSNSTISGNTATGYGGGIYVETGTLNLLNSIVLGNVADDIFNQGTVNAKYNVYGMIIGVILDDTNTESFAEDVFVDVAPADHVYVIKADGPAAVKGTLTGANANGNLYYRNMSDNQWYGMDGSWTGNVFDANDPNYGLDVALGTVITTAQNLDVNGDPVSRVWSGVSQYNAGAYALTAEAPGLVVTTSDDVINAFDGVTSLREALAYAGELWITLGVAQTVTFADGLGTIALDASPGELFIDFAVTVQGNGVDYTIVQAGADQRVFNIADGVTVTLNDMAMQGNGIVAGSGGVIYTGSGSMLNVGNVTVSGGQAGGGGGIFIDAGGTLNMTNSTVSDNTAVWGGGIYVYDGSITVTDSTVDGNTASNSGGGIYVYGGSITITDSEISGNTATYNGGGIYVYDTTVTITGSTVSGNMADWTGGGIYVNSGSSTINDSEISNNTASDSGGGILIFSGTANIAGSTVNGNDAWNGGGIFVVDSTLTITDSTVSGNEAGYVGGGINIEGGVLNVVNSTIVSNDAANGGGIFVNGGVANLLNNIIIGNSASIYEESDIRVQTAGTLNGRYNIVGTGTVLDEGSGGSWNDSNVQSDLWAVFVNPDNSLDIRGDGVAAYMGTLTATGANGELYYRDIDDGDWYMVGDDDTTYGEFVNDPNQNYGLTAAGATVLATAQNGVDRTQTDLAYNVGAYALDTVSKDSVFVTTDVDWVNPFAGEVSLREALIYAASLGGTQYISFDSWISWITLDTRYEALEIGSNVIIDGGENGVTIWVKDSGTDMAANHRVFEIGDGLEVTLNNLWLYGGDVSVNSGDEANGGVIWAGAGSALTLNNVNIYSGVAVNGGGICINGTLTVSNSTISGNTAGWGGGIYGSLDSSITITDSEISGNTVTDNGGGIFINGTLNISNSTVSSNTASNSGGGICVFNGTLTASDSTISGNTAYGNGGGIFIGDGDSITITGSEISGNTASYDGGGIFIGDGGTLNMTNSTVSGNTASNNGGGIYGWDNSVLDITDSFIESNIAADGGGGILAREYCTLNISGSYIRWNEAFNGAGVRGWNNSMVAITNTEISSNTALGNGGGIYGDMGSSITISDNSMVSGNSAYGNGGGIYVDSTLTVSNSTISGNTAGGNGGGISINSGTVNVVNSTIVLNTGNNGIFVETGTLNLLNSIVLGNDGYDIYNEGTVNAKYNVYGASNIELDYSNVQSNLWAVFVNPDNSLEIRAESVAAYFGTLTATGANGELYYRDMESDEWYMVGDDDTTYGEFVNDPNQNYGLTAAGATVLVTAQNGVDRTQTDLAYNIGAYALDTVSKGLTVTTNVDWVNPFAGEVSLREALIYAASLGGTQTVTFDSWIYRITLDTRYDELEIGSDVIIDGGENGVTISVKDSGSDTAAKHRVFEIGDGFEVTLNNLWLFGGDVSGEADDEANGGVIWAGAGSTLTLNNVGIYNGVAVNGGGIYGDTVIANNSDFVYNTAKANGGGIYADTVIVNDSGIIANHATNGGGIYGDTVIVNNSLIAANTSTNDGGGIYSNNVTVNDSWFEANSATANGGGIYGNTVSVANSTFYSNSAWSGGGIYANGGTVSVVNSTFYGNTADWIGGAIFADSGSMVTVANSTISGNIANTTGTGIYVNGTLNLINSIVLGNDGSGYEIDCEGTFNAAYSVYGSHLAWSGDRSMGNIEDATVEEVFTGEFVDGVLPILADGPAAGSGTLVGRDGDDFYFVHNGAWLSFTASGAPTETFDYDQKGDIRLVDGYYAIGALSSAYVPPVPPDDPENPSLVVTTLDDIVDAYDGVISLREALIYAFTNPELGYTITFDDALFNGGNDITITIDSELAIYTSLLVIDGGFGRTVTIKVQETGVSDYRVFATTDDSTDWDLTLRNLHLQGGYVAGEGGALSVDGINVNLTLEYVTVSGSHASSYGGGVYAHGSTINIDIINSTIFGNITDSNWGGGMEAFGGDITVNVINSTIAGNVVVENGKGGGIDIDSSNSSTLNLINSIVLGNIDAAGNANDLSIYNGTFNAAYSIYGAYNDDAIGDRSMGNIEDATAEEVFTGEFVDGVLPILADGPAAGSGTLVGRDGGDFYFVHEGAWLSFTGSSTPTETFDYDQKGDIRLVDGTYAIGALSSAYVPPVPPETPSLVVTTLDDIVDFYDGVISLREALLYAQSNPELGYTITFADALFNGGNNITITIDSELAIYTSLLIIDGGFGRTVTVKVQDVGVSDYRVFSTTDDSADWDITLRNLHLQGGYVAGEGGALYVSGNDVNLSLEYVTISGSSAAWGGGIYAYGDNTVNVNIINSTIFDNTATGGYGGGMEAFGGDVTVNVVNSTIAGNTGDVGGGIDVWGNNSSTLNLINSIILGNTDTVGNAHNLYIYEGTFNAAYSIYGAYNADEILGGDRSMGNIENATVGQVFTGEFVDGVLAIRADGPAAGNGTLAGYGNGDFYFMHNGAWMSFTGDGVPTEIFIFAQNRDDEGDPVRRDEGESYSIGAYAIDATPVPPVNDESGNRTTSSGLHLDYSATLPNMQAIEAMRNSEANFASSVGNNTFNQSAARTYTEYLGSIGAGFSWSSGRPYGALPGSNVYGEFRPAWAGGSGFGDRQGLGEAFESTNEMQDIRADIVEMELPGSTRSGQLTFGGNRLNGPHFVAGWSRDGVDQLTLTDTAETKVTGNAMFAYLDEALPPIVRRQAVPALASDLPELAAVEVAELDKSDAFKSIFDRVIEEILTI